MCDILKKLNFNFYDKFSFTFIALQFDRCPVIPLVVRDFRHLPITMIHQAAFYVEAVGTIPWILVEVLVFHPWSGSPERSFTEQYAADCFPVNNFLPPDHGYGLFERNHRHRHGLFTFFKLPSVGC